MTSPGDGEGLPVGEIRVERERVRTDSSRIGQCVPPRDDLAHEATMERETTPTSGCHFTRSGNSLLRGAVFRVGEVRGRASGWVWRSESAARWSRALIPRSPFCH